MKTASVIFLAVNQSQNWLYMHDQSMHWTPININLHVANTEKGSQSIQSDQFTVTVNV